jgi:alpha-1,3-rhamnosyltransferase
MDIDKTNISIQQPVSVIVTTYNSAAFLRETLESIRSQSYQNIELVISDDASTDTTLSIAREWLVTNSERFIRTQIVTVPVNTGVSANCNRCIKVSHSQWIKMIAGDDILLPTCIEDNMNFVRAHPEIKILFSYVRLYKNQFSESNFIRVIPNQYPVNIMAQEFSALHQHKLLLLSDRISFTPSYFFNKEAVLSVGGYDEANTMAEDYPMWLKLTKAGIRLDFMEKQTVGYRQHDKALNNIEANVLFKPLLVKTFSFRRMTVFPFLPWDIVGAETWTMAVQKIFVQLDWNKKQQPFIFLFRLATVYANPFQYIISFRKKILRAGRTNVFYAN